MGLNFYHFLFSGKQCKPLNEIDRQYYYLFLSCKGIWNLFWQVKYLFLWTTTLPRKIIAKRGSKHCISLLAQKITNWWWWWWCWQSWQIWWLTTLTCKFSKKVSSSTFMLCIISEVAIARDGNYKEKYLNFSTSNYKIWEKNVVFNIILMSFRRIEKSAQWKILALFSPYNFKITRGFSLHILHIWWWWIEVSCTNEKLMASNLFLTYTLLLFELRPC